MKLVRSIAFSLSVASVSVFAVACGGSVEHSPQTSASAVSKAPVGASTHGIVRLVGDALGEVPLRPEQRTEIEKLASEAEARHAPTAGTRKDLMLAFADQVERGSIDRAALVKLHDLLDSEQRNLLVDAVEKQLKGKREHAEHGLAFGFGRWKRLADDLKLTDAQKSQIRDVVRDARKDESDAGKDHARGGHGRGHRQAKGPHGMRKGLDAFRQDKLDLDKVGSPADPGAMAKLGTERIATFAEKIVPILTPEQRKLAADKLRAIAANGG